MFLKLSGPIITLVGVWLGLWGTLRMCRVFHPLGNLILWEILVVMWLYITGRGNKARQSLENASTYAAVNRANDFRTLGGVYVLVFSFFVQMIGASLIVADLIVHKT
ncbi:MAG TPA: hypothetical protein VFC39_19235 [Acidobacteriaceae bacterium]|nr:hypothetical protein [Acidobacteriaceae bacterium]